MNYRMKILRGHYEKIRDSLTSTDGEERGCFILCSVASTTTEKILLTREIIPLGPDDFLIQRNDQLSIKPDIMLRVARKADRGRLSLCMVHTHPMQRGRVDFSSADDYGNIRSFRFFNRLLPDAINTALIFDGNLTTVTGRVYKTESRWSEIERIEIVGEPYFLTTISTGAHWSPMADMSLYDRHLPLIGKKGIELQSRLSYAVIGSGGIGSVVNTVLVHSGAGQIMPIDPDRITDNNRPRIITATPDDVRDMMFKVDIAERYIKATSPECVVNPHASKAQSRELLAEIISVDAVICATDDHTSRAFLNQICQQYYIPFLDLGVQFVVSNETGQVVNEIGKVNLVLPATACLLCTGHIHPDKVRYESLPAPQKKQLLKEGYIRGVDEAQPSMMMFNMEVAARGIQLLTSHLLGIKPVDENTYERFSFFQTRGTKHHQLVAKRKSDNCIFCGKTSFCIGAGDSVPMLINDIAETSAEMEVEHA